MDMPTARDILTKIYLEELHSKQDLVLIAQAFKLAISTLEEKCGELRYQESNQKSHCQASNIDYDVTSKKNKIERIVEYLKTSQTTFYGRSTFLMSSDTYQIKNNCIYHTIGYNYNKTTELSKYTIEDILNGWFQIKHKDQWIDVKVKKKKEKTLSEKESNELSISEYIEIEQNKQKLLHAKSKTKHTEHNPQNQLVAKMIFNESQKLCYWNEKFKREREKKKEFFNTKYLSEGSL